MTDNPKKLSLTQSAESGGGDPAAKLLKDKLGDLLSLNTKPAAQPTTAGPIASDQQALEATIIEALQTVYDPEIPLNIYDLGLIYKLTLDPTNAVTIDMTLTAPNCPVADDILKDVKRKVEAIPEVPRATIHLVWEPAWTRDRLTEAARLELGL